MAQENGLNNEHDEDQFSEELNSVLAEAYPPLLDWLAKDWKARDFGVNDIANEACLRAKRHFMKSGKSCDNMLAYLKTITARVIAEKCADTLTKKGEHVFTLLDEEVAEPDAGVDGHWSDGEVSSILEAYVDAAINVLPERQRIAVRLHFESNGSNQTRNAAEMGISRQAFAKLVAKAQDSIQKEILSKCPFVSAYIRRSPNE